MATNQKPQSIGNLGRGIKMSFSIESKILSGKTEIVEGIEYSMQLLSLIFSTRKYSRPMRRRLGFDGKAVILRPILSSLRAQVEYYVIDALKSFNETRFVLISSDIDWNKSKDSDIYFLLKFRDVSTGEILPVSYLWEYIR